MSSGASPTTDKKVVVDEKRDPISTGGLIGNMISATKALNDYQDKQKAEQK